MTRRSPLIVLARNNGPELATDDGPILAPGEVAIVDTRDPVVDANIEPDGRLELRPTISHADDLDRHGNMPRQRSQPAAGLTLPPGPPVVDTAGGLELG